MTQVSTQDAEAVLAHVRAYIATHGGTPEEVQLHSHEHEGQPEGAWSIAYEGWTYDQSWPSCITSEDAVADGRLPAGVFLEPIASWCLGVYPA